MSLLDPTTLDDELPSLTVDQRDVLIEKAEAWIGGIIGRETFNTVSSGAPTPEEEVATVESGGGVTEDVNGDPITDPADPQYIPSPIGGVILTHDFYVEADGRLVIMPDGPLMRVDDFLLNGVDQDPLEYRFRPWTIRRNDNRVPFACGQRIQITGVFGFTRPKLPERIRESILLAIDIIRSKAAAGGDLKSLAKTSEALGPYRATFGEAGANSQDVDVASAENILKQKLGPWSLPPHVI